MSHEYVHVQGSSTTVCHPQKVLRKIRILCLHRLRHLPTTNLHLRIRTISIPPNSINLGKDFGGDVRFVY